MVRASKLVTGSIPTGGSEIFFREFSLCTYYYLFHVHSIGWLAGTIFLIHIFLFEGSGHGKQRRKSTKVYKGEAGKELKGKNL